MRRRICSLYRDLKRKRKVRESQKIQKIMPDLMAGQDWFPVHCECVFFSQKTCFLISVWRNSVSVSLYYQRFFVKESTFQLLTVYLFWARLLIWGLGKLEVLRRFQTTYIWTRVSTGRPGTNREGMSHCPFVPGLKKFLSRLPFAPGQWQELMSRDIPGQNRFPKRTKKTGKGRSKIGKWPDFLFQNIIFLF